MAISARRERIKKQVRADIIQTSKDIARQEGWQAVSIRKIADIIEYSPPILYEYFESKDHLLKCIQSEGFEFLKAELEQIKTLYRNPEKILMEFAQVQWKFMTTQTEVFEVMFNLNGANITSNENLVSELESENNHPIWEIIAMLRPRSAEMVTRSFVEWWSTSYGLLAIIAVAHPKKSWPQSEILFIESIRKFVRNLA